jgi:hypothetical protein
MYLLLNSADPPTPPDLFTTDNLLGKLGLPLALFRREIAT